MQRLVLAVPGRAWRLAMLDGSNTNCTGQAVRSTALRPEREGPLVAGTSRSRSVQRAAAARFDRSNDRCLCGPPTRVDPLLPFEALESCPTDQPRRGTPYVPEADVRGHLHSAEDGHPRPEASSQQESTWVKRQGRRTAVLRCDCGRIPKNSWAEEFHSIDSNSVNTSPSRRRVS